MKTLHALLIAAVLTVIGMSILKGQTEPQQNTGRFQIIQANYVAFSNGKSIDDKGMFKLDTVTGKTWLFIIGTDKENQYFQKWTPID